MLLSEIQKYLPREWSPMDVMNDKFELIQLEEDTDEHYCVSSKFQGKYLMGPIYRIQNPLLFTKFYMRTLEYEKKGPFQMVNLYHDTIQSNVESIVANNFDWKYGERFKYGPGVYFSTSSFRANKRSNHLLGRFRAMFLVDVLVSRVQVGRSGEFLPDLHNDTVVSPDGETYVKYFDNEFYPSYVQYYTNL